MRLLTRSDFDGVACAAMLQELGIIDNVEYIHPKDLQDNKIDVSENDILANVPLVKGCGLWFDHHSSENERQELAGLYNGSCEPAPSAARVVYEYYIKEHTEKLKKFEEMLKYVDIADSGQYTKEDILNPREWIMLAFIADPRTGLGYHRFYRISNFDLMKTLPGLLRTKAIDEILSEPDVQERVKIYKEQTGEYKQFIQDHSKVEGDAIVIDLRGVKDIPSGNRFIEYTIYPEQNISIRIVDGKNKEFVMISMGHSIINRTSAIDVGSMMLKHGGGGHSVVGTCQVSYEEADIILKKLLDDINAGK